MSTLLAMPAAIASTVRPAMASLDMAIKAKDQAGFTKAYGELTASCNAVTAAGSPVAESATDWGEPLVVVLVPAFEQTLVVLRVLSHASRLQGFQHVDVEVDACCVFDVAHALNCASKPVLIRTRRHGESSVTPQRRPTTRAARVYLVERVA